MVYERIKVDGRKAFYLDVDGETARFLTGIEVDLYGRPVEPHGADERRHVIAKTTIRERVAMRMNVHYAELEPST